MQINTSTTWIAVFLLLEEAIAVILQENLSTLYIVRTNWSDPGLSIIPPINHIIDPDLKHGRAANTLTTKTSAGRTHTAPSTRRKARPSDVTIPTTTTTTTTTLKQP